MDLLSKNVWCGKRSPRNARPHTRWEYEGGPLVISDSGGGSHMNELITWLAHVVLFSSKLNELSSDEFLVCNLEMLSIVTSSFK